MHGAIVRQRTLSSLLVVSILLLSACARKGTAASPEELDWFRSYLQIDTTNPPGNEAEAAAFLRKVLHQNEIPTKLLVSPAGRTSLYARLDPSDASSAAMGALVLTHHMDVVPPGPDWTVDPFAAEMRDGRVWGRGAVDVKSLGIAQLAAFVDLKRRQASLERSVIFLAVSDEEAGGKEGTEWLLERHSDLFENVAAVLGEGGANRVTQEKLYWWGVETAQKRPLWLEATAYGRAGHGSMFYPGSAPHQLARAISRLVESPPTFRPTPDAIRYLEAVAPYQPIAFGTMLETIDDIVQSEDVYPRLFPGTATYFVDSIQVNSLSAGDRINAVPGSATAQIDVRMLPDTDAQALLHKISTLLGDRIELEVLLEGAAGPASPTDNEIYRCLESALGPTPVVPAFIPGITDSRYYRQRGIAAYGFSPFALDAMDTLGIHAKDEHISETSFLEGVAVYKEVVRTCAAA